MAETLLTKRERMYNAVFGSETLLIKRLEVLCNYFAVVFTEYCKKEPKPLSL